MMPTTEQDNSAGEQPFYTRLQWDSKFQWPRSGATTFPNALWGLRYHTSSTRRPWLGSSGQTGTSAAFRSPRADDDLLVTANGYSSSQGSCSLVSHAQARLKRAAVKVQ